MAKHPELKDLDVRNLKPSPDRVLQFPDGKLPGFGVRITKTGVKSFYLLYRYNNQQGRLNLGRYPELSLAEARKKAETARVRLRLGFNPATEFKAAALAATEIPLLPGNITTDAPTFKDALDQYISLHLSELKASTAKEKARNLKAVFLSSLAERPLDCITTKEINDIIDPIKLRAKSAARHAHKDLSSFFNWHKKRRTIADNPLQGTPVPAAAKRDNAMKNFQILSVWNATEQEPYPLGYIAQIMLLTAQRRSEVAEMKWDELDLNNGIWTIPATRTKNGKEHVVPLSNFAAEILFKIPRVPLHRKPGQSREFSPYVFPRRKDPSRPMKWFSSAKRRLQKTSNTEGWTLHDMRRTAATGFGSLGTDLKARKKILNHAESSVTDIYDRFDYFHQRCEALHKWAEHVRKVINGEIADTPLDRRNPFLTIAIPSHASAA